MQRDRSVSGAQPYSRQTKLHYAWPEWKTAYGSAWDEIAQAQSKLNEIGKERRFRNIGNSQLFGLAALLNEYVQQVKKPDAERDAGFHEAELESTRLQLFSPAPTYPQLEERVIAGNVQLALDELGADDPFVKVVLEGKTPKEFAKALILSYLFLSSADLCSYSMKRVR